MFQISPNCEVFYCFHLLMVLDQEQLSCGSPAKSCSTKKFSGMI